MEKYADHFAIGHKIRELSTGAITDYQLLKMPQHSTSYAIIDDICDGGATFIELAKLLRKNGAKTVKLFVTHGIFSKGISVFDGLIDEVYSTASLENDPSPMTLRKLK